MLKMYKTEISNQTNVYLNTRKICLFLISSLANVNVNPISEDDTVAL